MSLRFLYTTDLHGNIQKFEDVFAYANRYDIKLLHLGADLLPKGEGMLKAQKKFIKGYLKNFYIRCHNEGITVLAFFGNDDVYTRKKYFRQSIGEYGDLLDEVPFKRGDYLFKAYPYVLDYPFGLKTACKLDYGGWRCSEAYLGPPCDYDESGHHYIENVEEYFINKGTIKNDLNNIHVNNRTVMAIHQPPYGLDLDVCVGEKRVGSKAVYDWIRAKKMPLVLCGHIHENYEVTGIWKRELNKTLVIQPGQSCMKTTIVIIDMNRQINAKLIEI